MHAIHHQRQHLHRTVWVTLLVWLFALSAGLVNACVLDGHAQGSAAHEHEEQAEQAPGKQHCLKFCKDEASAIAKVSLLVDAPVLASAPAPWPGALTPEQPCARLHLRTPPAPGPPLSIRLLHLSL